MAYRFKLNERAGKALLRTGAEQLRQALNTLGGDDAAAGIHGTRKCIKRLRALLRLARPGLEKAAYQHLNATLRDAGRTLSAARDRDVLIATAAELSATSTELRAPLRRISAAITPADNAGRPRAAVIGKARDLLQTAADDWQALELSDDSFATLAEGIERGLRDLGDAFAATEGGDEEAFHDLRKTVQRHWRHMRLIEAGWPAYFRARADEAKAISELLGKAQDLTLMLRHLRNEAPASISRKALAGLKAALEQRRAALQEAARARTSRLLAESPRAHARRATEYWGAARALRDDGLPPPAELAHQEAAAAHPTPRKRSARASRTTRKPA